MKPQCHIPGPSSTLVVLDVAKVNENNDSISIDAEVILAVFHQDRLSPRDVSMKLSIKCEEHIPPPKKKA
jgi:hypothetical protein